MLEKAQEVREGRGKPALKELKPGGSIRVVSIYTGDFVSVVQRLEALALSHSTAALRESAGCVAQAFARFHPRRGGLDGKKRS